MSNVSFRWSNIDEMTVREGELPPLYVFERGNVRITRIDPRISIADLTQTPPIMMAVTHPVGKHIRETKRKYDVYYTKINVNPYYFINMNSNENGDISLQRYLRNKDGVYIFELLKSYKQIKIVELKYDNNIRVYSNDGRALRWYSLSVEAGCLIFDQQEFPIVIDAIRRVLPKTMKRAPKTFLVATCDFPTVADEIIYSVSRFIGAECVVAPVVPVSQKRPQRELYIAEALAAGLVTLCGLRLCQP